MNLRTKRKQMSRADLLDEIARLPPDALINSHLAAAFLDTSVGMLANWRSERRGPPYCGNRDFVRYRLDHLQKWVSERQGEVVLMEGDHA